jgi:hypothetical protein
MKKVLATILAFVYLSSSMGATIHLHYCMGKLASWGLINHDSKNCTRCGMIKKSPSAQNSPNITAKMNCCRDEHKQIKTDSDQKLFYSDFLKYSDLSQGIALQESVTENLKAVSISIAYPKTNAPPLNFNLPRFILNCNFRL